MALRGFCIWTLHIYMYTYYSAPFTVYGENTIEIYSQRKWEKQFFLMPQRSHQSNQHIWRSLTPISWFIHTEVQYHQTYNVSTLILPNDTLMNTAQAHTSLLVAGKVWFEYDNWECIVYWITVTVAHSHGFVHILSKHQ